MDLSKYRQNITREENILIHVKMSLKISNEGLGIHSVFYHAQAAHLGSWASHVDRTLSFLGDQTILEKEALKETNLIKRIKTSATNMKDNFSRESAFTAKQATDIGLHTGKLSTMKLLEILDRE